MGAEEAADAGAVRVSARVRQALQDGTPVVALESALITHGLQPPENLVVARNLESTVVGHGGTPATIAVIGGEITVGLTDADLAALAESRSSWKIGLRDLAAASLRGASGGTTVAATMFAAHRAGIGVFSTGGIGGVHRNSHFDVSADLYALASIPMIVVCAGAKAILDLPATLEQLETAGVLVVGYGTTEFPAFYSRESGLGTVIAVDSPAEIAELWFRQRALGLEASLLVTNPIPEAAAIPRAKVEALIEVAHSEAAQKSISGQALTPFLLHRLGELSDGRFIRANIALLQNNAALAARIATAVVELRDAGKARS